jgi:ribonuclease HI
VATPPATETDQGLLAAVYVDESCLGNGRDGANPGGAGGLVEYRHPRSGALVRRDFWVSDPDTTNNRMALRSAIEAFRALADSRLPLRVIFTSDSLYLIKGLGEWVHGWAARNWTRPGRTGRGGAPIENLALWRAAIAAIHASGHEYAWQWVRGHHGHAQNEYANFLATRAAAELSASGGLVPSGFAAWFAAERSSGVTIDPPAPFPDAASFRAAKPLPAT